MALAIILAGCSSQSATIDVDQLSPRSAVIADVRGRHEVVQRIDRIEAKLTTWGEYLHARSAGSVSAPPGLTLKSPVWVVAVGGVVSSQVSSMKYNWGTFVYDARTLATIEASANNDQRKWPPYFNALADHALLR